MSDPDTKYWIVISQTTPADDGEIIIAAWGEWTGALEEGLATPPVDPGSEDGWSVDFEALAYYRDDPNDPHDDIPVRPELLPWETFGTGLEVGGRLVLRMALRVAPEVTVQFSQDSYTVAEGGTQSVTVTLSADPERTVTIPIETMEQGPRILRRLLRRPRQRHLQQRRDVEDVHLLRDAGHRGRRRREREAGLRDPAAGGQRGNAERDDVQHHRR